ncbi:MAG: FAD-binding oxidoreductase [Planctomycetaceae bacterium]
MNPSPPDASQPGPVVDYPVDDMTITVLAEMTTGQLTAVLARNSQQLPIDAADDEQTIGQLVMQDVCGPRQYGCGTLRDYVIGIEALDGQGRRFHAGGRVVKNVAGYDLCRMLVGSEGKLGTVTAVTFKVRPLPPSTALLAAAFSDCRQLAAALDRLNTSTTTPVILDVVNQAAAERLFSTAFPQLLTTSSGKQGNPTVAHLLIGFDGSPEACHWQLSALSGELGTFASHLQPLPQPTASADWCRTAQQSAGPQPSVPWLSRLTILPSRVAAAVEQASLAGCEIFGRAGNGVLFVRPAAAGHQADESAVLSQLQPLLTPPAGSLRVLRGNPAFNTRSSVRVQQLSVALQHALAAQDSARGTAQGSQQ